MQPSEEQWRLHSSEAGDGTSDSLHAHGKLHGTPCLVQQRFMPAQEDGVIEDWNSQKFSSYLFFPVAVERKRIVNPLLMEDCRWIQKEIIFHRHS